MSRRKKIQLNNDSCRIGIGLCIRNALRLVKNAKLLLNDREASLSTVYSLWSLAMEEYGKALLLKELYKQNEGARQEFEVDEKKLLRDHKNKFEKAKSALSGLPKEIKIEVQVTNNISLKPVTLTTTDGQIVSVGASKTGSFLNTSSAGFGKILSYALRFQDFYVSWDYENNRWRVPGPVLSLYPINAVESLSSDDVISCINILQAKLESINDIE